MIISPFFQSSTEYMPASTALESSVDQSLMPQMLEDEMDVLIPDDMKMFLNEQYHTGDSAAGGSHQGRATGSVGAPCSVGAAGSLDGRDRFVFLYSSIICSSIFDNFDRIWV